MKKMRMVLFLLVIFISFFAACAKHDQTSILSNNKALTNKVYFSEPDKILIYKNGNTQTINKEDKLFFNIVNEMNSRVDKYVDVLKLAFDENSMKATKQKEVVIEFVYSKNQKLKFGTIEKEYNNLIFPITGENKEFCFFYNNKNDYSGPIGGLKNANVLLDLLK